MDKILHPPNWKEINAKHFEMYFQGKHYLWKDKGHLYSKNSKGETTTDTLQAWEDIKNITPKGWAKKNVKLVKK
tara:strand:+ start:6147 stop:6368 length:222 start_codon:yes stop_codon:yes gene_type:complete